MLKLLEVIQRYELIFKYLILKEQARPLGCLIAKLAVNAEERPLQIALAIKQELEQNIVLALYQSCLVMIVDVWPLQVK